MIIIIPSAHHHSTASADDVPRSVVRHLRWVEYCWMMSDRHQHSTMARMELQIPRSPLAPWIAHKQLTHLNHLSALWNCTPRSRNTLPLQRKAACQTLICSGIVASPPHKNSQTRNRLCGYTAKRRGLTTQTGGVHPHRIVLRLLEGSAQARLRFLGRISRLG